MHLYTNNFILFFLFQDQFCNVDTEICCKIQPRPTTQYIPQPTQPSTTPYRPQPTTYQPKPTTYQPQASPCTDRSSTCVSPNLCRNGVIISNAPGIFNNQAQVSDIFLNAKLKYHISKLLGPSNYSFLIIKFDIYQNWIQGLGYNFVDDLSQIFFLAKKCMTSS